jgi:hypothetical protein
MSYRIQPSAQAEADIDRIFNWLSARSPDVVHIRCVRGPGQKAASAKDIET